jgi:hypothetical protein
MADHATGLAYAHAMNLRLPVPIQPKKAATVRLRWESVWSPRALIASKRESDDPADAFCEYHHAYNRRVRVLLSAGIAWSTITRSDLDSPLQSGTEFDRALCLAIERRRCRMHRIKGKKRGK